MGIVVVSNWKTSTRPLQVRRDALYSVGNPDCSEDRANEDDMSKQDPAAHFQKQKMRFLVLFDS